MDRASIFERSAALLNAAQLAQVVSIADPEQLNRVQVRVLHYDGLDDQNMPLWARVVAPFAGENRGAFFMPDVGDEVLVVFVQGDARHPLVIGGLWNGRSPAPASIGADGNVVKRIRSRNGVQITLEDRQGEETLKLETPDGQHVTLRDGPGAITVEDANGNSIQLETAGITINAAAKVTINASTIEASAGMVTVNAGMSRFSGVVQCDVLISNAVVSSSYTPGAGNIW